MDKKADATTPRKQDAAKARRKAIANAAGKLRLLEATVGDPKATTKERTDAKRRWARLTVLTAFGKPNRILENLALERLDAKLRLKEQAP